MSENFLGDEKYQPTLEAIYRGLGIPTNLGDNEMKRPTKPGHYKYEDKNGKIQECGVVRRNTELMVGIGKFYEDHEVYRQYIPIEEFSKGVKWL